MSDDANSPKRSSAQHTGAVGVTIVTSLVENELRWHFRRNHQEDDFGIDGYVDIVRSDGAVLGKSFAVQIAICQPAGSLGGAAAPPYRDLILVGQSCRSAHFNSLRAHSKKLSHPYAIR